MPQLTPLQSGLLEELAQAALLYQTSHTREEIALLSELFAEALADEKDLPAIWRAFALHRKQSKRFPTPAHILELLPECQQRAAANPLPEPDSKITPGFGKRVCEMWLARKTTAQQDKAVA